MADGFTGLDQLAALTGRLEQMGQSIDGRLKDKALQAGAEIIKDKIENHPNMPRSNLNHPHAQDNITFQKINDDQYDIGARDGFFYLLFHEIGAKGGLYRGEDDAVYVTPDIQAKPFMRPAFENNKDEIEQAMMDVIKRELGL